MIVITQWRSGIRDDVEVRYATCPDCGQELDLTDHEIAPDGTITPSLECATEGCDFHDMARLALWKHVGPLR